MSTNPLPLKRCSKNRWRKNTKPNLEKTYLEKQKLWPGCPFFQKPIPVYLSPVCCCRRYWHGHTGLSKKGLGCCMLRCSPPKKVESNGKSWRWESYADFLKIFWWVFYQKLSLKWDIEIYKLREFSVRKSLNKYSTLLSRGSSMTKDVWHMCGVDEIAIVGHQGFQCLC